MANLNHFLKKNIALNQLNLIAQNTAFSPAISGKYSDNTYFIITKYHLQFSNWTQVLEPIIEFYKTCIDEFGEKPL